MAKLKQYGLLVLTIILLIGWAATCNIKKKESKEALKKQEQNYTAIITDWRKRAEKKDTVFIGKVVESTPDEIMNSDVFEQLDSIQKEQIRSIAKRKALLAALEANLEILSRRIDSLDYKLTNAVITDSSIIFPKGEILTFEDTAGNYQFKETITLSDTIIRDFSSSIKLSPSIDFTRNRDKSIDGRISFGQLENSNINVSAVTAFYIPAKDNIKHPKLNKFWGNAKPYVITVGIGGLSALSYYGGVKTGVIISK